MILELAQWQIPKQSNRATARILAAGSGCGAFMSLMAIQTN